jgi:hypothetical protein
VYEYILFNCDNASTVVYTTCNSLAIGCFLYADISLTIPVIDEFYCSDPPALSNCYIVSGGLGEVTSVGGCG